MQIVKREIDGELTRFFNAKRKEAKSVHPALVELVDQIADVTLRGGKRLRPFLCWVGYSAVIARSETTRQSRSNRDASPFERSRNDTLMRAMLALELFQTFAIVHDDIMDEDKERRGGPTVHEHFHDTCHLSPVTKTARFGESMGILAGDLAFVWADGLVHNAKCQMINDKWNAMKEEVIYGQTLDVIRSAGVGRIEKSRMDELKTAWYSVVRPLQIGSSLAEGGDWMMRMWERFGVPAGKLFQLRDDVLDGAVDERAFEKEAKHLQKQSLAALEPLETSDEVRQLLVDFTQFVQSRNS